MDCLSFNSLCEFQYINIYVNNYEIVTSVGKEKLALIRKIASSYILELITIAVILVIIRLIRKHRV